MNYESQKKIYFLFITFLIVLIDQFTKYFISHNYKVLVNTNYILFKLDFVRNFGAAFNLFSGSRIFLSIISIIFSLILLFLILRKQSVNPLEIYSYSFILGGTIGNGTDRVLNGFVIDFINLNIINFPVFNIADISINIGFILFLYSVFKSNS